MHVIHEIILVYLFFLVYLFKTVMMLDVSGSVGWCVAVNSGGR